MPSMLDNLNGSYSEAFRKLKTNIRYSSTNTESKIFVITSCESGDGKTTVASDLAYSLSLDNKKVILIDGDLRKPSLYKKYNVTKELGLTNILVKENKLEQCIHKVNRNFYILPAGHIPPNPSELLSSEEMNDLLSYFKEIYDYVIVDSTPFIFSDAQILCSKCDGVILIAAYEKTKKDALINCKKLIEQVGGNLIGVILNKINVSSRKLDNYYGDYY